MFEVRDLDSPSDRARTALPGRTERVGPVHARPARRGSIRRAALYVIASMRAQPVLTLAAPVVCVIVGVSHLWATAPVWRLTAEYRIAAEAGDPIPSTLRVEVTPAELRDLLVSDPLIRTVSNALDEEVREAPAAADRVPGLWRQRAISAWTAVRSWPARAAAALGVAQSDQPPAPMSLRARPVLGSEAGQVVRVHLEAPSPTMAERAPHLLLAAVRDLLRREDRSRTMARIEELRPAREEAAERFRDAADAVTLYRLEIGRHDPQISAQEIQSRLIDVRSRRAELETDLMEAEANRQDIARKLEGVAVEQTSRVVVEQNQRIRQLKEEISGLEARYAADLAVKTPKHEDMVRLRLEIESRKRDLNNEEILVIREKVQEPSLEYVGLLERQAQNNRQLVTLAGRELGLAETESRLATELGQAMRTSQRMDELASARAATEEALRATDAELALLDSRLSSVIPFAHISLVGQPRVRDHASPDAPDTAVHLLWTLAAAIAAMLVVPTLRSLMRSRLVASWQIDDMAHVLPVHLVGELPGPARRLLMRLPGGGS